MRSKKIFNLSRNTIFSYLVMRLQVSSILDERLLHDQTDWRGLHGCVVTCVGRNKGDDSFALTLDISPAPPSHAGSPGPELDYF